MNDNEVFQYVDHTLLKQEATWEDIKKICDDAMTYKTASVCIPPCYVKKAAKYMQGKIKVCTVIGFPNGNMTTAAKVFETKDAIKNGASEIDMVINIGMLKAKEYNYVLNEIKAIKKACGRKILKVIIETCLLTDDEKKKMCDLVNRSGADFIKTSTGFSTAGATFDDVKLMRENSIKAVQVKAAGGISSFDDAKKFLELGATRLGTSRIVKIAKEQGIK
jgi:deoxyribose-phosphate aldolase